jgi:hypothetical protein
MAFLPYFHPDIWQGIVLFCFGSGIFVDHVIMINDRPTSRQTRRRTFDLGQKDFIAAFT